MVGSMCDDVCVRIFGQVGLIISIGGMLVFALVVGIVAESISESIDGLRHGKTRVIESNHTVLLNWSSPHCQDDSLNQSHAPALTRICTHMPFDPHSRSEECTPPHSLEVSTVLASLRCRVDH